MVILNTSPISFTKLIEIHSVHGSFIELNRKNHKQLQLRAYTIHALFHWDYVMQKKPHNLKERKKKTTWTYQFNTYTFFPNFLLSIQGGHIKT